MTTNTDSQATSSQINAAARPGEQTAAGPHVVIVGAGFAGLVAARELQTNGVSCQIVEARDRIGGRAWTETRMGRPLEIGATWVHWFQPHIWAEITRYGQDIVASPYTDQARWITGGQVVVSTEERMDEILARPMAKIFENSERYFPNPYRPLDVREDGYGDPELREQFEADDHRSVLDVLREDGSFTQEEIDLANAYWSAGYIGNPETTSVLMAKQWAALSDHQLKVLDAQTLRYKLAGGMQALYNGIAGDLTCPIRLSTPVTAIRHDAQGASVTLEGGEEIRCDAVIVTVPLGALDTIEFTPALPAPMRRVVDEKWNSTGCKIWIKIKGHHNVFGYAPAPALVSVFRSEYFMEDGTTICVGFGSNHEAVDLTDREVGQAIVDQWFDDIEVVECTGHDWVADRWSGQAWATLRQGQFTDGWHHFRRTGTRMHFAGADWARGWRGVVVDGALETGVETARDVLRELGVRA